MKLSHPIRVLLLGAPGSGKGTQTSRLLKDFPINSLSSGDILRSQIKERTPVGITAQEYITNGSLVPDKVMIDLITGHLKTHNWLNSSTNWLLDGFPRTKPQAIELNKVLGSRSCPLNLVVELDVPQSLILQRIEARWVHLNSGRVYNLDYNPPKVPYKDDITGEPLTKRDDDTAAVFQKRLDGYNEEIKGLRQVYEEEGVLFKISGETSDIIYPQLKQLVLDKFS
ncbi:GTP:AMP phosphotransferase, mitochondrial [[Candida] jaroonii]|uniref:GTP:AMP phosphotransferase, mitochondrial n=1 Tax=[Candida] jaroonii TaxID=467808 RepID=A0ACA9YCS0_9ASCO|nr:GTP:AMP phosphotransferase, mitochondrial [[Candida] jaroonii]